MSSILSDAIQSTAWEGEEKTRCLKSQGMRKDLVVFCHDVTLKWTSYKPVFRWRGRPAKSHWLKSEPVGFRIVWARGTGPDATDHRAG